MSIGGEFKYEVVPGFFRDISTSTEPAAEQVPSRFGLIDSSPSRWNTLRARLVELNATAPPGTTYRVLFIGRHGQGFHNVAESVYGTPKWNEHMSKLDGDGNITWGPDPKLTELGIRQARVVQNAWKEELEFNIPLPESLYTSPLSRALHTASITFDGILTNAADGHKRFLIKEKLREENGVHSCDRRSPRSYIAKTFPVFDIEPNFTEDDELWDPSHRETGEELRLRLRQALDEIFNDDPATYISITAHGGAIRALMEVVAGTSCLLPTGGVISFVLKVTRFPNQN